MSAAVGQESSTTAMEPLPLPKSAAIPSHAIRKSAVGQESSTTATESLPLPESAAIPSHAIRMSGRRLSLGDGIAVTLNGLVGSHEWASSSGRAVFEGSMDTGTDTTTVAVKLRCESRFGVSLMTTKERAAFDRLWNAAERGASIPPHPNLHPVTKLYRSRQFGVVCVSPLAECGHLWKWLHSSVAASDVSCEARLGVLLQVCRGLAYLHEYGLPHLNLKPSNVLMTSSTSCAISDMACPQSLLLPSYTADPCPDSDHDDDGGDGDGDDVDENPEAPSSPLSPSSVSLSVPLGPAIHSYTTRRDTDVYMSPELGKSTYATPTTTTTTTASDMWSFGVVAFRLLLSPSTSRCVPAVQASHRALPSAWDALTIAMAAAVSSAKLPSHLSELHSVLQRCVSAAPTRRPTAVEVIGVLERTLVSVTGNCPPDNPPISRSILLQRGLWQARYGHRTHTGCVQLEAWLAGRSAQSPESVSDVLSAQFSLAAALAKAGHTTESVELWTRLCTRHSGTADIKAMVLTACLQLTPDPTVVRHVLDSMGASSIHMGQLLDAVVDNDCPDVGVGFLDWLVSTFGQEVGRAAAMSNRDTGGLPPIVAAAARQGQSHAPVVAALVDVLDCNVDGVDANTGDTALIVAAAHGNVAVVNMLLDRGARVNRAGRLSGRTALLAAAVKYDDVVRTLLRRGADVNCVTSDSGAPPLTVAAGAGSTDVVLTLLKHGVDPNQPNAVGGATPLIAGCANGFHGVVLALITHGKGADVDFCDNDGRSPLWMAAAGGHADIVKTLVSVSTATLNRPTTKSRQTPVWVAAAGGHADVVDVLIQHGARLNEKDDEGLTPAMISAAHGHLPVLRLLARANAATMASPRIVSLARKGGHTAVELFALSRARAGGVDVTLSDTDTPEHRPATCCVVS